VLTKKAVVEHLAVVFGKGNLGFFIAFVLIGGILGTALGSLFASLVPALAILKTNLVPNAAVDLVVMSVSFNINPLTIAGMCLGIFFFIKI